MNAIVQSSTPPMSGLVPTSFDEAVRLARAMSSARLVPKHLQDDPGSCLLIVEQAMRWRMSPFAVAQATSVISGKLMYEGKLVAAAVEASGAIQGGFSYAFKGDGDNRTVTASAIRTGEREPRTVELRLADVRTENQYWKKQPDQQLVYSSSRVWARRWAPAVILGVYVPEEMDRATGQVFDGPTIDGAPEPPPPPPPPPDVRRQAEQADATRPPPQKATIAGFIDGLEKEMTMAADNADALATLLASDRVKMARETFRNGAAARLGAWEERARARLAELRKAAPPAPPVPPADADADDDWPGGDLEFSGERFAGA